MPQNRCSHVNWLNCQSSSSATEHPGLPSGGPAFNLITRQRHKPQPTVRGRAVKNLPEDSRHRGRLTPLLVSGSLSLAVYGLMLTAPSIAQTPIPDARTI